MRLAPSAVDQTSNVLRGEMRVERHGCRVTWIQFQLSASSRRRKVPEAVGECELLRYPNMSDRVAIPRVTSFRGSKGAARCPSADPDRSWESSCAGNTEQARYHPGEEEFLGRTARMLSADAPPRVSSPEVRLNGSRRKNRCHGGNSP